MEKVACLRLSKASASVLFLRIGNEPFGVFRLHQGLAAENCIRSRISDPPCIFRFKNSALTDLDDPIGYQREKVLRGRQIRGELAKISVVDAENLRVELEGSCQLLLFMNFIKTIQSGGIRTVSQVFQILVVERPYDQ